MKFLALNMIKFKKQLNLPHCFPQLHCEENPGISLKKKLNHRLNTGILRNWSKPHHNKIIKLIFNTTRKTQSCHRGACMNIDDLLLHVGVLCHTAALQHCGIPVLEISSFIFQIKAICLACWWYTRVGVLHSVNFSSYSAQSYVSGIFFLVFSLLQND